MAPKRPSRWLFLVYLTLFFSCSRAIGSDQQPMSDTKKQPNILFIFTDDQDMHMDSLDYMPALQTHLVNLGTSYKRHYCTVSLCCPSRASLWTGKAAHNTNVTDLAPPYGGYPKFIAQGFNSHYLPIWMQDAGYGTYYVGKFLNSQSVDNYDDPHAAGWTGSDFLLDPFTYQYYNSTFQRNFERPVNHKGEYSTDLVASKSLGFLDEAVEAGKPFFLVAAPIAPHSDVIIRGYYDNGTYYNETSAIQAPPVPAKRHANMFPDAIVPRTPSFNPPEPNGVAWIATLPRQNQTNIDYNDSWYRNRLRTLQAVDDMIDALIARLNHHGILDNTYIFYSTDNGYHIGQHRLQPSKQCAYQEDTNIPLIVRGPGVRANQTTDIVTSHTDLVPTFLTIAGAPLPDDLDGSAIPIGATELNQVEKDQSFGELVNIEMWGIIIPEGKYGMFLYPNHTYKALRLIGGGYDLLYTVWCTGAHELYDLVADPYETKNLHPLPTWYNHDHHTTVNAYVDADVETGHALSYIPEFTSASNGYGGSGGWPGGDNSSLMNPHTLPHIIARLDALMLVLKTCKADTCRNPWLTLHPEGDVHNLTEALNPQYDYFYEVKEHRVQFKECVPGYLIDNELPIKAIPYSPDWS